MNRTRPLLPLAALGLVLALTGCGSDEPSSKAKQDTEPIVTESATAEATPEATTNPLPITAHVVTSLPGLEPQGEPEAQDAAAFAEAHEKTVAELRRAGFVSGSSLFFGGKGEDFGLSIAAAYEDAADAAAEADRLYASNTEGDPGIEITPVDVPGIPGAQAAAMAGDQGGTSFSGLEIVFVDGAVLHEVFAVGETARFDTDAMISAVTALYDEVQGRPLG